MVATIQTSWPDVSKQRRDATFFREGKPTDKMENNSNKRPEYKKREAWIEKIRNLCMEESKHTGIYPSVTIAMSILESADGTSYQKKKQRMLICEKEWKNELMNYKTIKSLLNILLKEILQKHTKKETVISTYSLQKWDI